MSNDGWQQTVMHEFTQLQRGDIPFFSCCASGTALVSVDGHRFESLLSMSGVDAVRARLTEMSEPDLRLQEWIIRASMASLGETSADPAGIERSLKSGDSVADRAMCALRATCIMAGSRASWLTLAPTTKGHEDASLDHQVEEVGIDLYDGLAGIAFFLFAFAEHANDEHALHMGNKVLNELDRRVKERPELQPFGAFIGLSGILYAYAHIARWFPDKSAELQARAASLLPLIASKLEADPACDLMSGRAGAILCFLAAQSVWADRGYLDMAAKCGKDLVDWRGHSPHEKDAGLKLPYQRGMSHGYAGIAMALATLGAVTKERLFITAALELTHLEASLVVNGDWTDPSDEHHAGQVTWCHGAPGIAMARLVTLSHAHEPWVEFEARNALAKCLDAQPIDNESLCHGTLGNLDALAHAAAAFPSERSWADKLRRESSELDTVIAARGLRCARPNYVTVPGLMTGLSGIGYGSLRLASPLAFPSVLTLASPLS